MPERSISSLWSLLTLCRTVEIRQSPAHPVEQRARTLEFVELGHDRFERGSLDPFISFRVVAKLGVGIRNG
jgi:hypothetical protein